MHPDSLGHRDKSGAIETHLHYALTLFIDDDMKMEALASTNVIKAIVTCDGKMDLERKNKQSYQGMMYVRMIGLGNGTLKALHDKTNGFYRRQIIIQTKDKPVSRVDDPFLKEKLEAELDGILLWCMEGLHRLVANRYKFTVSERSKLLKQEFMEDDNNIKGFLTSTGYIAFDPSERCTTKKLYTVCIVDVDDSPETWETIEVARTDIVEVLWTTSRREITEYDGYKIHPKRLKENASEEERRAYEEEKALAKLKSEAILKKLRSKSDWLLKQENMKKLL